MIRIEKFNKVKTWYLLFPDVDTKVFKNSTFKQKVFRVSLNTAFKADAVKLSYRLRTVLYDHEDMYKNNPDGYGLALNKMKQTSNTKWANDMVKGIHEDWERETAEDKLMLEAGLGFVHKIDVLGLDANEVISDKKQQYCYDIARKQLESNPELLPKLQPIRQPSSSADLLEDILNKTLDKREAVSEGRKSAAPSDMTIFVHHLYFRYIY